MTTKKVYLDDTSGQTWEEQANALLKAPRDRNLREALKMTGSDDKKWWPQIARYVGKCLAKNKYARYRQEARGLFYVEVPSDSQLDAYDGYESTGIIWSYASAAARTLMHQRFRFDCAMHPRLWRYLVERLPVLLAKKTRDD